MSAKPQSLQELVEKAEQKKGRVLELDEEVERLSKKLSALQSEAPNVVAISTDDERAMLKLAARTQAISILPVQVEELVLKRSNAVLELLPPVAAVRSAIEELALAEKRLIVKEISSKLRPYSVPIETETQPGKKEMIDTAVSLAWQTTIIGTININAFTEKPPDMTFNGYSEEQRHEAMKKTIIDHADEVLSVARRFLDNASSFVSRNLYPSFKS
jgi:hypothetical protein